MRRRRRKAGAAAMAGAVVLLLLTWWARGAADAAEALATATIVLPQPAAAWAPRWIVSGEARESGSIAGAGAGLIVLAACVRRTARPGQPR